MDVGDNPRVVLVHDWLTGMRGGEKCLEVLCRRWPSAPLYTLLHRPGSVTPIIEGRPVYTSWMQRLPKVHRYYRYLLPLMPAAARGWHLPACDLVLSLSHCVAKSVQPPDGVPHVCYCFTPMRYAWHLRDAYFHSTDRSLKSRAVDAALARLRDWDRHTAARVTHFVAISRTVQRRILECYNRDSAVIYPPVDTNFFSPGSDRREDFYLAVSALAPYKRLDLAIEACNRLRRRLIIVGSGQHERRLRALAGPTISFLGWQSDTVVRQLYRTARALLFPGEEDFGIVPVEAQACGTPVIAFGRGGATETLVPAGGNREPTALFFHEQQVDVVIEALDQFERSAGDIHSAAARRQALRFNQRRFAEELFSYLAGVTPASAEPERRAAA